MDSANSIRLGDFGLATVRRSTALDDNKAEDQSINMLDDISHLLGGSQYATSYKSYTNDGSITGGVGTRFYCAPEQEHRPKNQIRRKTDYDTKADVFSFGVVLFEIFHHPFATMSERAETLEKLRSMQISAPEENNMLENDTWKEHADRQFTEGFRNVCPQNAQKLILWCLQHNPDNRPTVGEILKSNLIPQLENYNEILKTMFNRQTAAVSNEIDITWDTDSAAKVREFYPLRGKKSVMNTLLHTLHEVCGSSRKDMAALQSSTMNCVAMCGANLALQRSVDMSKIRGAPHKYSTPVLAMSAAASGAITGNADGFLPRLTDSICNRLSKIFELHGAVRLKPPLLRPKAHVDRGRDGLVEFMNERGIVLTLPEDLTCNFARSVGRAGGLALKRYDIDKTYHKSRVGGHPRESLEASFDIVLEADNGHEEIFQAEVLIVVCQMMKTFVHHTSVALSNDKEKDRPFWFLRLNHTKLADSILDVCDVPATDSTRQGCFQMLTKYTAPAPSLVLRGGTNKSLIETLDEDISKAISQNGLTKEAGENLKLFISNGCMPLPPDLHGALRNVELAAKKSDLAIIIRRETNGILTLPEGSSQLKSWQMY